MQRGYHENSREFTGSYWALKGLPASSQGGSPGSSPLRSDGSRDDQVGEAGPVEHNSAEAKSLKTRGQGTVLLPPQWATAEAARREGPRPNKGLLSQQFTKEHRALSSSDWKHSKAKGQRRKTLTLCSNLEVAEGDGVRVDEVGDE